MQNALNNNNAVFLVLTQIFLAAVYLTNKRNLVRKKNQLKTDFNRQNALELQERK